MRRRTWISSPPVAPSDSWNQLTVRNEPADLDGAASAGGNRGVTQLDKESPAGALSVAELRHGPEVHCAMFNPRLVGWLEVDDLTQLAFLQVVPTQAIRLHERSHAHQIVGK